MDYKENDSAYCPQNCKHLSYNNQYCSLYEESLCFSYAKEKFRKCKSCIRNNTGNYLKEPVLDPAQSVEFVDLYGFDNKPPKKPECALMYDINNMSWENIRDFIIISIIGGLIVVGGICMHTTIIAIIGVLFIAAGVYFNILPYILPSRYPILKSSQPILNNLTQIETELCAKISNLPNKNKLIKQCKQYANTLANSKTDQPIEPLLTKLYNICANQLTLGLRENVSEVECFISAMEEVEKRNINNEEN